MSETGDHIKHLRLFDIGRDSGFPASEEEKKHLRACEECQRVLDVFARQFEKPRRSPPPNPKGGNAA